MWRIAAVPPALVSAFFAFYEVRLLIVTSFLRDIPSGGRGGAIIGAVVFPIIALGAGLVSRWCWRRGTPR